MSTTPAAAPSRRSACATRRARAAGAEQHDAVQRGARQPALEALGEPGGVGVVADRAAVAKHDRVDRAERLGLVGELVEVLEHDAACTGA